MKPALPVLALVAVSLLMASCSDDPFRPTGPYSPPEYHATLQSLNSHFAGVCGAGEKDLYAFGDVMLHYDGSRWQAAPPPEGIQSWRIFGRGFEDGGVAVCDGWQVAVLRDGEWSAPEELPDYAQDIWGLSSSDFWVLCWPGVYHTDGSAWAVDSLQNAYELTGISGDASGNLVLCGGRGRVDRFDGETWTSVYTDSFLWYRSVATTPSGRTFLASDPRVFELVGNNPVEILTDEIRDPVLCVDGERLFVAGRSPYNYSTFRIAEYSDAGWRAVTESNGRMEDFWAGHGDLACVGYNNFIWQGTPSGGDVVEVAPFRGILFDAVAINDAIYAVGDGAYRYANGKWENLDKEYVTRNPASGIGGRREDDIYAVGIEMILHYDGASWAWVNAGLGARLRGVWVEPNGHVVAVGDNNAIVSFDGETWRKREVPFGGYSLNDVTGFGATVFAVGDNGLVCIRRNGHWYVTELGYLNLYGVWGADERHVYAVGEDNRFYFYDGYRWDLRTIEGPDLSRMQSIWGTSDSNIFVLDYDGTLARFNGRTWSEEERLFGSNMRTVTGTREGVYIVGDYGTALYRK